MKISRLLLLFIICCLDVNAQQIEGFVYDEYNNPLSYANVLLCNKKDTTFILGCVSNEEGRFSLSPPEPDNYILKVSYIGYNDLYYLYKDKTPIKINMSMSSQEINNVIIKAKRPTYQMKGSTLVTNVQNTLLQNIGTANDLLRRIPGVLGSEGDFQVFGKGAPEIYINNRLVRDNSELSQLSAKDIAQVELLLNPGAEYDASIKSVLKIKTIKPQGEGFSGYASTYGSKGYRYSGYEQLNLNYRYKELDVFGSISYLHRQKKQKQNSSQKLYLDSIFHSEDNDILINKNQTLNTQVGVNYNFLQNHHIGIRYDYSKTPGKHNMETTSKYWGDQILIDDLNTSSIQDVKGNRHKINMYYNSFLNKKWTIDFNMDYINGNSERDQFVRESSIINNNRDINTINKTTDWLYAYKIVGGYKVNIFNLKIGNELSLIERKNDFINTENILPSQNSYIKDRKLATFFNISANLKDFNIDFGVRHENISYTYFENDFYMPDQSRSYNHIYPYFSASYNKNDFRISLSYSETTKRPYFYQLRSDIQYNNRFSYETGNPALQPQLDRNAGLYIGYKDFVIAANYSNIKDYIALSIAPYPKDNRIILFSVNNYPKFQSLNWMFNYSPKWGIWEPSFSIYLNKPYFSMYRNNQKESFNKMGWTFYWENLLNLPHDFILSVDMNYATSCNWNVYYTKSSGSIDFSIQKYFLQKKLNIKLQVFDILATQKSFTILYGEESDFTKWNYNDTRQVRLTLTYRFNSTRSKYKGTSAAKEEINRL